MDRPGVGPVYRFGAFELDAARRRLRKDGRLLPLPDRQLDVLLVLCAAGGQLVPREDLAEAGWHGIAVTENSIDKAVSALRQLLGPLEDGAPSIEMRKRVGVRLVVPVSRVTVARPAVSIEAVLEPDDAFVDGRRAIAILDTGAVEQSERAFAEAVRLNPDLAQAHTGLANSLLLKFEATRADAKPDRAALERALHHASEAIRLDETSADAWSTLACVRHELGISGAISAARRAVRLGPQGWLHHLRHAHVTWGSERLDATTSLLAIYPDAPLGHRFAATVHVARQAFDLAKRHLLAGGEAQDAQDHDAGPFRAVGLHLLHGLVLAAEGDGRGAQDALARELAIDHAGHVFARECGANTCYAIGALALADRRPDAARAAFGDALARLPHHALAAAGLAFADHRALDPARLPTPVSPVDAAIVRAAVLALQQRHAEAAALCHAALRTGAPGSAGYLLPVEPLIGARRHREVWAGALLALAARAS